MKVIKRGKVYRVMCDSCGAQLEYTQNDIDEDATITCPECHNTIPHTEKNRSE